MIFIDLEEFEPNSDWIALACVHTLDLVQDTNKTNYIERNQIWNQLINVWRLRYNKCWITESKNPGSNAAIEHFRPKGRVSINGTVKNMDLQIATRSNNTGYWWLAYDWRNYRLVFDIPNTSKSIYFPLKSSSSIAMGVDDNEELEINYLIDPTKREDIELISIEPSDGTIKPTSSAKGSTKEKWNYIRAIVSIAIYDLDNPWLINGRMTVIKDCKEDMEKCLKNFKHYILYKNDPDISSKFLENVSDYILKLKGKMEKEAIFSSAASACIKSILNSDEYADLRQFF